MACLDRVGARQLPARLATGRVSGLENAVLRVLGVPPHEQLSRMHVRMTGTGRGRVMRGHVTSPRATATEWLLPHATCVTGVGIRV